MTGPGAQCGTAAYPMTCSALWQGTDGVDQRAARAVIDLAMRVGETLLSTGASASDMVATALRLTDAYGLRSVPVG